MSSYDYGHNTPDDTPSGKKQTESEILSWILIFISFMVFWPLGLFLLIRKLSEGKTEYKQSQEIPPLEVGAAAAQPERRRAPKETAKKKENFSQRMTKTPSMKKGTRLALKIIGGILVLAGVLAAWETITYMFYPPVYQWEIIELLQECAIAGAGGLMLGKGIRMDRAWKRYANYLAIMSNVQSISFRQLAETTGYTEKRVIDDLEHMIEKNYFGPTAYLDVGLGYFFRSRTAAEDAASRERAKAATPREAEEGYAGVLRDIRRANDQIADPVLSQKIDRLEEVTAQIFRVIEKDEKKARQVRTFLEYYLPTTQKLLDSYVEFEAAGVDGQNLRMAKEKIEATMDDIVRGFENQLDALYAAKAMDIQSDIDVMNNMMKRDSAMSTSDFKVTTSGAPKLTLDPQGDTAAAVAAQEQSE